MSIHYAEIPKHPRYEISKSGVIRNKNNKHIKSQYVSSTGYYMVSFSYSGKTNPHRVHRLIAQTYIDNPQRKPEINHIDGVKLNNDISNLEWCTHKENMHHAFKTGLANNTGEKNGQSKLKECQVLEIKELLKDGILSQYKIADLFGVSRSCILGIKLGRLWKHVQ